MQVKMNAFKYLAILVKQLYDAWYVVNLERECPV
jgi:hypothetical protein